MGNRIDVRILKLDKWYVPKTTLLEKQKNYIAIGYFDAVQLRGVQIDPKQEHPFIGGYNATVQWKEKEKESLVDYSSQEQMLFANIREDGPEDGTGFKEETINDFWKDLSSPYLFLSMIHINHIGNLEKVLKIIKKEFKKDYLSYISFDYCDIIVFAKGLYIKDFLRKIKRVIELSEENNEHMVFDTFSLVSFHPSYLRGRRKGEKSFGGLKKSDQFSAAVNLSVKDYKGFTKWYKRFTKNHYGMYQYDMFGRHNISIVNDFADTDWLLNIMSELHKKKNQSLFWTFETYLKVPENIQRGDKSYTAPSNSKLYEKANEKLGKEIENLEEVVKNADLSNKHSFLLPVCEVRDCICSIAKNSFAEEFIYCIFESFQHFIAYMADKIGEANVQGNARRLEEDIAESYDKYFTALNTLVNSTMHSERQFIQATAFNAIFYSVPPKITAFYNAYIYRIKYILDDKKISSKYTFLIYPSFSPVVAVEKISLEDTPPCDRILSVRIDEKALYDVEILCYQLVHELAHYIGADVRCRKLRSRLIIDSLLKIIIKLCDIQDAATVRILKAYADDYVRDIDGYTENMKAIGADFLKKLTNDDDKKLKKKFQNCLQSYKEKTYDICDESLSGLGLDENSQEAYVNLYLEQYCEQKYAMCISQLRGMSDADKINPYRYIIDLLRNIYSECYADLQMILVLAANPEEYLRMFFSKHGITAGELWNNLEDLIRVGIILKIMFDCEIWEMSMLQDDGLKELVTGMLDGVKEAFAFVEKSRADRKNGVLKRLIPLIKAYKAEVENSIGFYGKQKKKKISGDSIHAEKNDFLNDFFEPAYGLYEYLLDVMEAALAEYQTPEKCGKIREVREIVKQIFEFEDPIHVFNCIEKEIDNYKKVLFDFNRL